MSQPSGWYDDPEQQGTLRYWDGARWTDHRQPKPVAQQAAPPQGASYQPTNPYQGAQYHQYQGQPYPGGQPRKRSGGPAIAIVLVLGLVLAVGLVWQVLRGVGDLTSGADPNGSTPSTTAAVPVYYLTERPGYADMKAYVEDVHEKYSTALSDGTIDMYVPNTDEGHAYAQAFVYILTDYKVALIWDNTASTYPEELDAVIQSYRDTVAHYEELFLAGEDLGVRVSITHSDGTVFESDGVAPELVYDDPEEFARNFNPRPGDDGTYVDAATELAAAFGMEVTYTYEPGVTGCSDSFEFSLDELEAVFCSASPDLIWVNPAYWDYPNSLSGERFVDSMRHEVTHRRIFDICGTIAPPIAGASFEAVTNSYAVLYLGMSAEYDQNQPANYQMNAETDRIAEAIANGTCS